MSRPYDLKAPCSNCPFRTDVKPYLTQERVRGIRDGLLQGQGTFYCHKTTDLGEAADDEQTQLDDSYIPKGSEQVCAGSMILLEKIGRPDQLMRIAERIGMYDRKKLVMDSPVFSSFGKMEQAQEE